VKRTILTSVVAVAALAAPAAQAGRAPSLQLVDRDPLTVAGANFKPLGSVKVTLYAVRPTTRATRASRAGSFRLVFDGLPLGRCGGGGQIRATGAHGEVAVLKLPQPACMAK